VRTVTELEPGGELEGIWRLYSGPLGTALVYSWDVSTWNHTT